MTYSSVVSRDTVKSGFLMAALNGLCIISGNIQNDLVEEPTQDKILIYSGNKWNSNKDRFVVVFYVLYGLKSSALQFSKHLAETLGNKLGFKSSLANPDLWYKTSTSPDSFE